MITENSFSPEEVLSYLHQFRDQAIDWVAWTFCNTHPQFMAQAGENGRRACREDVDFHWQYLSAAVEFQSPRIFTDYIHWLVSIMENRGISAKYVQDCLQLIDDFMSRRLSIAAAAYLRNILDEGVAIVMMMDHNTLPAFYQHLPTPAPEYQPFTEALIEGNRSNARDIVNRASSSGSDVVEIGVGIVQPALYSVGHLWQINRISVAQEHLATALCQNLLAQLFMEAELAEPKDRKALFACVESNHHSLGLRMISDAFELEGWEVEYLGANTPTPDLIRHIDQCKPELLGLSLALPQHVPVAKQAIERFHAEFGARCPQIMVGGLALNNFEPLWKSMGADFWCPDAREARWEAR